MSSRRNRSGPAISLFAFQDIITSVSGIIIVMVLLLSLELVERPETKPNAVASAVAAEVEAAIAEAEAELKSLQGTVEALNSLIGDIAETSPAELTAEIDSLRRRIEEKKRQIEQLQNQAEELELEEKDVLVERFDLQDERARLETVEQEIAELEEQIEQETSDDRLVFSLPKGFRKSGWLAVIEAGQIETAPLGREARPLRFVDKPSGLIGTDSASDQFLEWAGRRSTTKTYFLLLVRPSGAEVFDELETRLNLRGFEFGFDLIAPHQAVLHPERGAAP